MERSPLPASAFIAPDGSNREAATAFARQVLDLVLAHLASTVSRSPLTAPQPIPDGAILPEHPLDDAELLDSLSGVLKNGNNSAHPGYVGHMDTVPALA